MNEHTGSWLWEDGMSRRLTGGIWKVVCVGGWRAYIFPVPVTCCVWSLTWQASFTCHLPCLENGGLKVIPGCVVLCP